MEQRETSEHNAYLATFLLAPGSSGVKTDHWCLCLEKKHLDPCATNLCSNCLGATSQLVLVVKNPPANAGDIGDAGSILGQEDSLEKEMATHSSILAWRIPWTEEPDWLQYIGSCRV